MGVKRPKPRVGGLSESTTLGRVVRQIARVRNQMFCSVSNFTSPHDGVELHRTRESKEWWVDFFKENGYERDINLEIYFKNEWVRWGTFNFVLVKV